MEEIKVPFLNHIYSEVSDKVHFVKTVPNDPETKNQRPNLQAFPYLMFVDHKDQIVVGLEALPNDMEVIRGLLRTCLLKRIQTVRNGRKAEHRAARWADEQDPES